MKSLFNRTKKIAAYTPDEHDAACTVAESLLGDCGRIMGFNTLQKVESVKNANVATRRGKVWFGDIHVAGDTLTNLQTLANRLREDVYVLREMDGRFDNEKTPLFDKAVFQFTPR